MALKQTDISRVSDLIFRRHTGTLDPVEQAELDTWLKTDPEVQHVFNELGDQEHVLEELRIMNVFDPELTVNDFHQQIARPAIFKLWRRIGVAAAVAAVVVGVLFYTSNRGGLSPNELRSKTAYKSDIAPGKNTATLTFAGGKTITLSEAKAGVVIDTRSLKYNDGSLIQNYSGADSSGVEKLLTASTPRGGTYQITLPDGSRVWLNAASSLTFSSTLGAQGQRMVKLRGEAYFEVAKMKNKPFIVATEHQEVEVLGTHFNISAYEDDKSTATSLLEGSVRVRVLNSKGDAEPSILKPNQQSILTGNVIKIKEIDPNYPVAWKNGYFMFASEPIESIMKKLSRWYDVEIDYQGKITKEVFIGSVSKYEHISEVLNTLELTGLVHFKIKERRITVMP